MPRSMKAYPGVFKTESGTFGYRFLVEENGMQKKKKKIRMKTATRLNRCFFCILLVYLKYA